MGQNWPNLALKSKILKYTCVICHFKGNFKQNTNSLFKIEKNVSKSSGGGVQGASYNKIWKKIGPRIDPISTSDLLLSTLQGAQFWVSECSKCFFSVRYCPPSLQEKLRLDLIFFWGLYKYRKIPPPLILYDQRFFAHNISLTACRAFTLWTNISSKEYWHYSSLCNNIWMFYSNLFIIHNIQQATTTIHLFIFCSFFLDNSCKSSWNKTGFKFSNRISKH